MIALAITSVIWYGVTGNRAPTTKRLANVSLVLELPGETEASNEVLSKVDVTVTGDKARVARLNAEDLIVTVDMTGYKPGELVVQLKPETVNFELPSGIKLEEIEPNKMSVRLEQRVDKSLAVKPAFVGELPEGYEIYETSVNPATVRVRGAASRVNALDSVATEKINLLNKTGNFIERQITIDAFNPQITILDAVVDVSVRIGEKRVAKTFENIPVNNNFGARIQPETTNITLFGAPTLLENLNRETLRIEIEQAENGALTPKLILPPDLADKIQVRSFNPNSFSIAK